MARARKTNATKGSRAINATTNRPTPISSALTTPLSSAYPSTNASEAEYDVDDDVAKLQAGVSSLSLSNQPKSRRVKQPPFRFLELPSELRLKVYGYHFANTGVVLDLDPDNYKRIHQKLAILRTCRLIHREASYHFYNTHPVRIFPTHPGRFFKTKKPLLARMKPCQRESMSSLELRLGPGWSKPPRGWVVNEALGLSDCVNVFKLTVFIECDPGNDIFRGFRQPNGFYDRFSRSLLSDVLDEMPWVKRIEFDAWPSVKKSGALMRGLMELATSRGLKIVWGEERGWTDEEEVEPQPALNLNDPLFISHGNPGVMVVV